MLLRLENDAFITLIKHNDRFYQDTETDDGRFIKSCALYLLIYTFCSPLSGCSSLAQVFFCS